MAVQTNFIESDNGVEKAKDDLNVIDFDDFKELDEEGKEDEDDFPYIGLCVPQDPIEDLEWYPNFDSGLLDLSLIDIDVKQMPPSQEKKYNETPMITTKKPRSKRVLSDVELSNEEKLDSALSPNANSWNIKKKQRSAIIYNTVDSWSDELLTSYDEKPRKKVGRPIVKRTCSHCGTNSTPQWREGPMGRNTLCNVCGVRYKSGRLVPEYRPLNCPDFDIQVHSNRHKKIVKKKKAKDKLDLEWLPYRK